ncbi:MAG: NAD(P)-dependent oxidoreductase, partial [Paracoccaceae bacterium]|nr:NAD(P)-dependent oxidoreductase [Paracoccaceae bacterium]
MSIKDTKPVVGFIGVGFMGHGLAKNILLGGYELWIKGNTNRAPIDDLVSRGAKEAMSIADMVQHCDVIHLCLPNSDLVEQTIRGTGGVLETSKPGLVIIDTTTSLPDSTILLATDLAANGMSLIDAPLGRTPKEAEAGTVDAMVGGGGETVKFVEPIIECWATTIKHIGPVGSAHKIKLVMNFLSLSFGALYSEALSMSAKAGISPQIFRDVIGPSRMGSGFFESFMKGAVDRDPNAHKFTLSNSLKDISYAHQMASDAHVVGVMSAAAKQYYMHANAVGGGEEYLPLIADYVARMNGFELAE